MTITMMSYRGRAVTTTTITASAGNNYKRFVAKHEKAMGALKKSLSADVDGRLKKLAQIQKTLGGIAVQEMKDVDDIVQKIMPFVTPPSNKTQKTKNVYDAEEVPIAYTAMDEEDDLGVVPEEEYKNVDNI